MRVRKALNYAINKKEIAESLLKGYCAPSDQPLPKGVLGFAKKIPEIVYPYDPKKAKQLLTDAGLPNGFEFTALVISPPFFVQLAEALQAQLATVGIKMNVQPAPIPQVNNIYFQKGSADAYVGLNLAPSDPSATMANLYLSDGFFNPSHFSDPTIQDAYKKTIVQTDSQAREAAFETLVKAATSEVFHVGLCNVLTPVAYSGAVKHVSADVPTWTWDFYGVQVQRN